VDEQDSISWFCILNYERKKREKNYLADGKKTNAAQTSNFLFLLPSFFYPLIKNIKNKTCFVAYTH